MQTHLLRRRADLSPEAFFERLEEHCLPRLTELAASLGASDVRVVTPLSGAYNQAISQVHGDFPFDAMVQLSWPDLATYEEGLGCPRGLRAAQAFADLERTVAELRQSAAVVATDISIRKEDR
ncbi:MAG: EthD domain-containing protein [Myxococcota bacterium]